MARSPGVPPPSESGAPSRPTPIRQQLPHIHPQYLGAGRGQRRCKRPFAVQHAPHVALASTHLASEPCAVALLLGKKLLDASRPVFVVRH